MVTKKSPEEIKEEISKTMLFHLESNTALKKGMILQSKILLVQEKMKDIKLENRVVVENNLYIGRIYNAYINDYGFTFSDVKFGLYKGIKNGNILSPLSKKNVIRVDETYYKFSLGYKHKDQHLFDGQLVNKIKGVIYREYGVLISKEVMDSLFKPLLNGISDLNKKVREF